MRIGILILAWITPALIAGALGWSGIWGSGSAILEFLIPIPVAGGALHVPSFAVAAGLIWSARGFDEKQARGILVLAILAFMTAISLQLDFDRLNAWLFTDYAPHGSPLRLRGNAFSLFVASDAFWVAVYALSRGHAMPLRYWSLAPVVPLVVIAISVIGYHSGGPVIERGRPVPGAARGTEISLVYTSAEYDNAAFMDWFEHDSNITPPWEDVNVEHLAILFTTSKHNIAWGRVDQIDETNTVATFCLYEEDRSIIPYPGYHDCFADRNTFEEDLKVLVASESTGLGRDIDYWYANIRLCDAVEIAEDVSQDIARPNICLGNYRVYPDRVANFIAKYGQESPQVSFVKAEATKRGLGGT